MRNGGNSARKIKLSAREQQLTEKKKRTLWLTQIEAKNLNRHIILNRRP